MPNPNKTFDITISLGGNGSPTNAKLTNVPYGDLQKLEGMLADFQTGLIANPPPPVPDAIPRTPTLTLAATVEQTSKDGKNHPAKGFCAMQIQWHDIPVPHVAFIGMQVQAVLNVFHRYAVPMLLTALVLLACAGRGFAQTVVTPPPVTVQPGPVVVHPPTVLAPATAPTVTQQPVPAPAPIPPPVVAQPIAPAPTQAPPGVIYVRVRVGGSSGGGGGLFGFFGGRRAGGGCGGCAGGRCR